MTRVISRLYLRGPNLAGPLHSPQNGSVCGFKVNTSWRQDTEARRRVLLAQDARRSS